RRPRAARRRSSGSQRSPPLPEYREAPCGETPCGPGPAATTLASQVTVCCKAPAAGSPPHPPPSSRQVTDCYLATRGWLGVAGGHAHDHGGSRGTVETEA